MEKIIHFTGPYQEAELKFKIDSTKTLDEVLASLSNAIAERRRKTLRVTDGRGIVNITALYKIKRNNEQVSRVNLTKIITIDQISQEDALYVSIRPSNDIKIKRRNRVDLAQQEEEKREAQQKIHNQAEEIGGLKARIKSLETQLEKANAEKYELQSQIEKITSKKKPIFHTSSQKGQSSLNLRKKGKMSKEEVNQKIVANQVELFQNKKPKRILRPNSKYLA